MKKFLTFLALALITVTGAWAGNITSVDQAKEGGYYTIVCPRSALTVSSDMTTLLSAAKAGTTFNAYDPNFLFQFVKSGDNYVLYNVGAAKYFTNAGNAVDNISDADALTLYPWGDGTAQLRWDNDHALNIGGQMEIAISNWKNKDVGNQYTVAEVEPCKVVVKGASVSVTVKGTSYANGATIPVTTSFSVSDVVAPSVEGYTPVVAITGNELVVNYQPNIDLTDLKVKNVGALTTTVTEGQWYVMTQTRDGETPVYDQGANQKLRTEESSKVADIFTVLRPANEVSNYLIRFINTGAASYAIQFANGNYWYVTATPAARNVGIIPDATNFQKFIFNEATNTGDGNKTGLAFNATEDGVTFGANLDHNNISGGATLNFWGDGKQTSGANNVWYIYPVEIGTVSITTDVTYNYYFKNTLIDTKTSTQEIGATVAAPPTITQTQHVFTGVEYDETAVVADGATVRVDVIETTPFIAAESVDKIEHWYALSIRDVNWLYNTGSAAVTGTSNYEINAKYAWGFVGNIFDGYVIYNKEAGTEVALDNNIPCTLSAAGTSVVWSIPRVGTLGDSSFGLQTSGQDPINWQSSSLKRWSGFDLGSSFKVVEVDMGLDGALKAAIAAAKANLDNYANISALYTTTAINAAKASIDALVYDKTSQASIDAATANLQSIMDTFYKTAEGKKVALVSKNTWSGRGATLYLTASDNTANNLTAAAKKTIYSVFSLTYSTDNKAYDIHTTFEPSYYVGQPVSNSAPIAVSSTPVYYTITPQADKENAIVEAISGSAYKGIHVDGSKNIVVWDAKSEASQWAFEEVSDEEYNILLPNAKTYTVHITGAPENTKVTIDGAQYGDGETVYANLNETPAQPATISLYNAVVTVDGLNLNIDYVACGIKTMAEIVQGKAYTITAGGDRGAFIVKDGALTSTYKAGVDPDPTDSYQQFLFVKYDNKYYFYNVGAGQFITPNDGKTALNSKPVEETIEFLTNQHSSKATNPVVLSIDGKHVGVSNGYSPAVITSWNSLNDEGNSLRIWPVDATIDMEAVLAKFKTSIEITIGSTGYATIAYTDDLVKPEGLKVYYCIDGDDEGHLTPVEWEKSYLPYYCAYILEGTPGTYSFEVTNDYEEEGYPAEDYEALEGLFYENLLRGNFDDTDITVDEAKAECRCDNIYVFSKKNDKVGFYTYVGTTLAAHKAYYATATALVNGFTLDFGGQTVGVNSVISATNLKAGYDIQGRRINKVQKGINILGGKKIIK